MTAETKTTLIEITDTGPILYQDIPLLPEGGVQVLRGENGIGKTYALNAVRAVLGADVKLFPRDGAAFGTVAMNGTRLRVATRQTRSGNKADLGVLHLEDQYDLSKLVDPGLQDPARNDMERIRVLVHVSGATVPNERFTELIPLDEGYDQISLNDCLERTETVERADCVKRAFESAARQVEKMRDAELTEALAVEKTLEGIDLDAPSDAAALQLSYKTALREQSVLDEQQRAHEEAVASRERARSSLAALSLKPRSGPTVADAEAQVSQEAQIRDESARNVSNQEQLVEGLRAELKAAEAILAVKQAEHENQSNKVVAAEAALQAAKQYDEQLSSFGAILESEVPKSPSEDDVEAAADQVAAAEASVELGARVRDARARKGQAEAHRATADRHADRAGRLRDAARAAEEILSECVKFDDLAVRGGRLIFLPKEEQVERLSEGERYKLAFRIGAKRVSEVQGDGHRVLVLSQSGWQDMQPANRRIAWEVVRRFGVTVVTAECDDGPLRVVTYNPDDPEPLAIKE